jgi:two-component system response regulator PhoP
MRVLYIEPEATEAQTGKDLLENAGYTVTLSGSGKSGIERASGNAYDLIILELQLPDMHGLDAAEALVSGSMKPALLVLSKEKYTLLSAFEKGADDFLLKPYNSQELIARVRALTRRSGMHETNIVAAGDIRLDLIGWEATVKGASIHLSSLQFRTLELLLRKKNTVITRGALEAHMYPNSRIAHDDSMKVLISRLRRTLRANGSRCHITTIREVGYRFDEA